MASSKGNNMTSSTSQVQGRERAVRVSTAKTRKKREPSEITLLEEQDVFLFNEGTHFRLYEKLGAHLLSINGVEGTYFAVWAPTAEHVAVMGEFNSWDKMSHPLYSKGQSGIWERFFPGIGKGTIYKYHIVSRLNDYRVDKMDPFAFYAEVPPKTASVVWELAYEWGDPEWMQTRSQHNALDADGDL
jgi:1,4-alpha-glucan branching enzyme